MIKIIKRRKKLMKIHSPEMAKENGKILLTVFPLDIKSSKINGLMIKYLQFEL